MSHIYNIHGPTYTNTNKKQTKSYSLCFTNTCGENTKDSVSKYLPFTKQTELQDGIMIYYYYLLVSDFSPESKEYCGQAVLAEKDHFFLLIGS